MSPVTSPEKDLPTSYREWGQQTTLGYQALQGLPQLQKAASCNTTPFLSGPTRDTPDKNYSVQSSLPVGLGFAGSARGGNLTSFSAQSCFFPFLSQVLIPGKHPALILSQNLLWRSQSIAVLVRPLWVAWTLSPNWLSQKIQGEFIRPMDSMI